MRHKIFDPKIAEAIYIQDPDTNDDEYPFGPQTNDEKHARRLKYIQKIANDALDGYRDTLTLDQTMISKLENQKTLFPNMVEVIELVQRRIAFSKNCGDRLDLPPIILNGGPGVGKTRFVKTLADILGTTSKMVSVNTLTGADYLTGLTLSFSGASIGCIAEELVQGRTAAPIFILDEIEKFSPKGSHSQPNDLYNVLHSYFEKENACNISDEYLQMPFDCSHILWFATCNSVDNLPLSFLDRVDNIDIAPLTKEQKYDIVENIFITITAKQKNPILMSEEALAEIVKHGLRPAQRIIKNAIGHMLLEGRDTLTKNDIIKVSQHNHQLRHIGFI